MGYMHILNVYKDMWILMFRRCYAMEKIHGTSSHISWTGTELKFFSGGATHTTFVALFDQVALQQKFTELFGDREVAVYGEAYGGKIQGMSATYGPKLKFAAFDVMVGGHWLDVPNAEDVVKKLGLEFVDYAEIECTVENLDAQRDRPSVQAIRNGITEPRRREGIVVRPLRECNWSPNGEHVIAKHKNAEFCERATPQPVDEGKRLALEEAEAIAMEWVVAERLKHVLDHLGNPSEMRDTGKVIEAMIEDVMREAEGEIVDTSDVRKAIGKKAAQMYKEQVSKVLV